MNYLFVNYELNLFDIKQLRQTFPQNVDAVENELKGQRYNRRVATATWSLSLIACGFPKYCQM